MTFIELNVCESAEADFGVLALFNLDTEKLPVVTRMFVNPKQVTWIGEHTFKNGAVYTAIKLFGDEQCFYVTESVEEVKALLG